VNMFEVGAQHGPEPTPAPAPAHWETFPNSNNVDGLVTDPNTDYPPVYSLGVQTTEEACAAAANTTTKGKMHSWTW
jgi:hypothetical protein